MSGDFPATKMPVRSINDPHLVEEYSHIERQLVLVTSFDALTDDQLADYRTKIGRQIEIIDELARRGRVDAITTLVLS